MTGPAEAAWRGPLTVSQVLARASAEMDEEDQREAERADPLLYAWAQRRRTLLGRLLCGKGRS